jgi:hypothetical protein
VAPGLNPTAAMTWNALALVTGIAVASCGPVAARAGGEPLNDPGCRGRVGCPLGGSSGDHAQVGLIGTAVLAAVVAVWLTR